MAPLEAGGSVPLGADRFQEGSIDLFTAWVQNSGEDAWP